MREFPEFIRIAWTSDRAREVWEPRVAAIAAAWLDVELTSVAEGLRPAALVFDRPGLGDRLRALSLERAEVSPGRFVVASLAATAAVPNFLDAWAKRDDRYIGEALGFPACCRAFFDRVWNREQKRDTTLSMGGAAVADGDDRSAGLVRPIEAVPEANILGRWLGVRLVPHLPCAFDCAETVAFARRLAPLWPRQELAWAAEILSWPVTYSALHGVAVVTWPVLRAIVNTDYTSHPRRLQLAGSAYPAEAPRGLVDPFRPPARIAVPVRRISEALV